MEQIVIIPKNKKQASVIKAFLEEMKIRFRTETEEAEMTEEAFYAKIDEAKKEAKSGKRKLLNEEMKKELFKSILWNTK